jgi:hypothetical protein
MEFRYNMLQQKMITTTVAWKKIRTGMTARLREV